MKHDGHGRLYICATPIGNLDDASARLIDTLCQADAILAEDTRVTKHLCTRFEIATPLERCDENVIRTKSPDIIDRVRQGERIAFVSDAGTPCVSDPGQFLVRAALDAEVSVEVIPGPSAAIAALSISGLACGQFFFGGFLPRKEQEKESYLVSLAPLDASLVFYESPHRTLASLLTFAKVFPGRECVLARELTKIHEELIRGTTEEVHEIISLRPDVKGEVVLLVGPPLPVSEDEKEAALIMIRNRRDGLLAEGASRSDVAKVLVAEFSISRNEAYEIAHEVV